MGQTVYVAVGASSINTFNVDIPSGVDTTSGYYLTYNATVGEGGGFTGTGWYLTEKNDPFEGYIGITDEQDIIDLYQENGGDLTNVFSTWIQRLGDLAVSNFCNKLMNNAAYTNGCITMTGN